jgi:hypothetical protein
MNYINLVLFWIFFGFWSSYLAKKKERNPTLWFGLGILLGVVGVILIAILPKPVKKMLRRPVVVEPMKELPLPKIWFYLDRERKAQGPYTTLELKNALDRLNQTTFMWCEGMENWKKMKELPELQKEVLE